MIDASPCSTAAAAGAPAGAETAVSLRRRVARVAGQCAVALVLAAMLGWATLAVLYADTHAGPRTIRAILVCIACVTAVLAAPRWRYGLLAFGVLWLGVLIWFFSLSPSNARDWSPDVAETPWAEIDGDRVVVHNVRNFDYRTETDFTPAWEVRRYDLLQIQSADLMLAYWGSPAIAHVMVSFGFRDGQYIAFSIETRKERDEAYSAVEGFFRQYELVYVVADERDVVRVRTNFRKGEDVYVYRTTLTAEQARNAFLSYLRAANDLRARPQFYNALTSNCASNVLEHARQGGAPGALTMDVVLSGYAARQAYQSGVLDRSLPYEELRARSCVNEAARAADKDPEFSARIRAALPRHGAVNPATTVPAAP